MGLMTGQHPNIPYPTTSAMPAETLVAQPAGSPTVCPLAYDGRLLAPATAYPPRLSMADLYGAAYPDPAAAAAAAAGYMAGLAPAHPAAMLYPTALTSPYDLKDPRAAWAALPQATGYPCDPTLAAYGAYGDRFDPVDSEARRRNATRETTSTLKAWLNEHRKNPYPTKGEKIMLAIITKMTLTQVSTWFANARRRLKKENKMTWEPRNKTADDLDDVSIDGDDEKKDDDDEHTYDNKSDQDTDSGIMENYKKGLELRPRSSEFIENRLSENEKPLRKSSSPPSLDIAASPKKTDLTEITQVSERPSSNSPPPAEKPKIWSLAQTATSVSPPAVRRTPSGNTFTPPSDTLENRFRMNRLLYQERLLATDPYHIRNRDISSEMRSRVLQDSSSESSLSSPPLWRTGESVMVPSFDGGDIRSVSSSSSGSPAVVTSGFDVQSPSRFLGCRLIPGPEITGHAPLPLMSADRFHGQQPGLDLRIFHTSFMRPGSFPPPVSLSSASSSHVSTDIRR